jgi:3-phenylpropionate/cinnamic acid dioxygenase small subunit
MTTGANKDALLDFIYHEAHLLDDKRFAEWHALFADDGVYWVPLTPGQTDPIHHASLMFEDRTLLKVRIDRLAQPRAYSQHPESRSLHVLQRPMLMRADGDTYHLRTPMMYSESRGDTLATYAATAHHELVQVDNDIRIRCKRVDILNSDAPLPAIQLFL